MDDNAMKAAEERFEAWWAEQFGKSEHGIFRVSKAYLAADAEATKRTAQRCVEIAKQYDPLGGTARAISKEYDL